MAEYVLLYTGGGMPETEEEQAKVMAAWDTWYKQIGGGLKDGGNPFGPAAKTVASDGSVGGGAWIRARARCASPTRGPRSRPPG